MRMVVGGVLVVGAASIGFLDWFQRLQWLDSTLRRYQASGMADAIQHPLVLLAIAIIGLGLIAFNVRARQGRRQDQPIDQPAEARSQPKHSSTLAMLQEMGLRFQFPFMAREESGLTWMNLESRFKELRDRDDGKPESAGHIKASPIKNDGRIDWWVHGSVESLRRDAEQLCRLAGRKLGRSRRASTQVRQQTDDLHRWLWFLVEVRGGLVGVVPTDVVQFSPLLDACVQGCLECMRREMSPTP